jgi:hypothetical protein
MPRCNGKPERRVQNPPKRVQSLLAPFHLSNPQETATFAEWQIRLRHRSYVNGTARALASFEAGNCALWDIRAREFKTSQYTGYFAENLGRDLCPTRSANF